jgi:hypothetical protein
VTKGRVFLFDSASGQVVKVNSPLMLDGLARPAEYQEISKAVVESSGSRKLREKYGTVIDGVMCATRPFDFQLYAYAAVLNTYHARAIRAKAKDIVGGPWRIAGDGPDALRTEITEFFTRAFGEPTFGEGMANVWTDYEALGNGYVEVVPDVRSRPSELTHIPATEMWIRLDGLGFVQQKNGECSHFLRWGAAEKAARTLTANDPLLRDGVTPAFHYARYSPWSPFYGIPSIMPAWNRLALSVLEAEYNLSFFQNNAIPDYAVILQGDWEEDAEETIRGYFRTHLKGRAHKTMVITAPNEAKITFEQLTSDAAKEAAFRLLRSDCRDEILHAHGVPPQKVGIVETGKLGGNLASEQIEEYKNSIVTPGREKVTARLNRLISEGWRTDALWFAFDPYDTEDAERNSRVDAVYLDRRVVTPNEIRAIRYADYEPLPEGDIPLTEPAAAEGLLTDLQHQVRAAIAKSGGHA